MARWCGTWQAATAGRPRLDLDEADLRDAARTDPALFVSGPSPVCIDEYQHVPELLSAIKAELNRDLRPGRYLLTGSTTYSSIRLTAQSLTGRLHRVDVWPLSQGEIDAVHETFLETLLVDPAALVSTAASTTTRAEYEERVVRGGMPIALSRPAGAGRNRWFDDYVALVVERDVMELSRVRQRAVLPTPPSMPGTSAITGAPRWTWCWNATTAVSWASRSRQRVG
jgi:uncharacterized protein